MLKTRNAAKATEADRDFHFALVRPAGNPELAAILDQLKVKLRRIEIAYFDRCAVADRSVEEHLAIIHALRKGDIDDAADAVATNWHNGLTRLFGAQTAPADEQQG